MKSKFFSAVFIAAALSGCQGGYFKETPYHSPNQNMATQQKYKPQSKSAFFADATTNRQPVAGAVAQGEERADDAFYYGISGGDTVKAMPVAITPELLKRGQNRFTIYCAPCHGQAGDGKGIVIEHGYLPPPNYHEARLRGVTDGHLYTVISNGIRNMQGYKSQISVDDRWAIVSYIRALQRAQYAASTDVPEDIRKSLEK